MAVLNRLFGKTINGLVASEITTPSEIPSGIFNIFIQSGETLTGDRSLTLIMGDASRILTLTADASIGGVNTGDQDLSSIITMVDVLANADISDAIGKKHSSGSDAETAATLAALITGGTPQTTPLDADEFPFYKMVGTILSKVTWANIIATIKTAIKLDELATAGTSDTTKNANTTNHGLLLKAVAPAAGLTNIIAIENGESVYKLKALFAATAPSTQAYGDAAAVGTAGTGARGDHKHGMPAAYTHPTSNGNIHLPASGASTQLIQYSSAGTGKWISVSGDITIADNGAVTISANKVLLSMLATQAAESVLVNATSGAAVPTAVALAEQTVLGRITGGHIVGLTATQIRTLINVADGATANTKASGAEINAVTDDTKFATSKAIGGSTIKMWKIVPSANYTAAPASTSTITMGVDMTASVLVGMPLRYTIGGVEYFGIVAACASNLLTVAGAPLSGDVSNLQYGGGRVDTIVLPVSGYYEDASDTALLANDNKTPFIWRRQKAYVVYFQMWSRIHDGGATHGQASIRVNNIEVHTTAGGALIAANATWYPTTVDIAVAAYGINYGEALEVTSVKGTTGDAQDLCAIVVIVTP